jgi:hypothetical protein
MDPRITLVILAVILIYSLFYTYNNDFSMFLYLILLIVAGLFVYQYIEYRIDYYSEKIDSTLSNMKNKIDSSLSNIHFIKNIMTTLFNQGN